MGLQRAWAPRVAMVNVSAAAGRTSTRSTVNVSMIACEWSRRGDLDAVGGDCEAAALESSDQVIDVIDDGPSGRRIVDRESGVHAI